jgi:hypothetical protein
VQSRSRKRSKLSECLSCPEHGTSKTQYLFSASLSHLYALIWNRLSQIGSGEEKFWDVDNLQIVNIKTSAAGHCAESVADRYRVMPECSMHLHVFMALRVPSCVRGSLWLQPTRFASTPHCSSDLTFCDSVILQTLCWKLLSPISKAA